MLAATPPIASAKPTLIPQIIIASQTAAPTLSTDEAQARVLALLRNNADCRLPCWWGATPGTTSWKYIAQLSTELTSEVPLIVPTENADAFTAFFLYPIEIDSRIQQIQVGYHVHDSKVEMMEVYLPIVDAYNLSDILQGYGPPSEAWISTYNSRSGDTVPFYFVIVYRDLGLLAQYLDMQANVENGRVQICLQRGVIHDLALWSPTSNLTARQVASQTAEIRFDERFRLLQDVTNITPNQLQDLFTGPVPSDCLSTAASLWPDLYQ
jgi:hypothetical protein